MTDRQDWQQPPQHPHQGYGQQHPQHPPWQPQQYHPGQHQQRLQGPPPGYGQVQQYAPSPSPYQGYLPYAQPPYAAPVAPKSTGTGLVLGLLLPGVGCMYAGRVGIGVLIMGIWLLSIPLVFVFGLGFLTGFAAWIASAVLGYTMTREWNTTHGIVSLSAEERSSGYAGSGPPERKMVIAVDTTKKCLVAIGAGLILAAVSACGSSAMAKPVAAVKAATLPAAASFSSSSASSADITASCQIGEDNGGFAPATTQNVTNEEPEYQVVLNNGTSSAVTVNGFAVTITALGSTIGSDNPSVNPALMEPTETWNFTEDITSEAMPQVSDNTYLNSTCTVTSVDTDSGQVTPSVVAMQNGVANTHNQDVQQAQQSLASDVSSLTSDTATLNNDASLAQAIDAMKNDYQQEQSDWQTEQNTACSTDEVGGDADTVGGDADTVGGDLDTLNGDVSDLQDGDIKSVQTDLSNVASDLTALQGLGASPATSSSAAVTAGNTALTSAANAISWADGQGQNINAEAQALATTAQNYASSQCG